jgi:hypothetical protein
VLRRQGQLRHLRARWNPGHYESMISNRKGDNALRAIRR